MKIFGWLIIILLGSFILGISVRMCSNTADVIIEEFSSSTLLKKYEYFKEVSAQLDKKVADIKIFEIKIQSLSSDYKGIKRKNWARDDREQFNIWKSELDGIKASYNELAASYNSAMSKFNYAFCNVGTLPKGAEIPLPREFKPYITE